MNVMSRRIPGNRNMVILSLTLIDIHHIHTGSITAEMHIHNLNVSSNIYVFRSSITKVMRCDILADKPLGNEQPDELYDCVMSSLCLDSACTEVPEYAKAIKNLVSFVKPGTIYF